MLQHLGSYCYCTLPFEGKDFFSICTPALAPAIWHVVGIFKKCSWNKRIASALSLPLWPSGNVRVSPSSVDLFKVLTVVSAIAVSLIFGAATLWTPGGKIKK